METKSLYERLGGVIKIAEIVDNFADRASMDPVIQANPTMEEANKRFPKPVTKFQVTLLVCEATGGPYTYVGRTLKESHKHLHITQREWEAFVADVAASLDICNVPQREKDELLAIVESTKDDCIADEYLTK
jgi:hemoglobin